MNLLYILPAIFLGWVLGANDSVSVFGPLVATGVVRYRIATLVSSFFVVLGATVGGGPGITTLSKLTSLNLEQTAVAILAAAVSVLIMILLRAPSSISQSIVGSLIGLSVATGCGNVNWGSLGEIVALWIATPLTSGICAFLLYKLISHYFRKIKSVQAQDAVIKAASILGICYGSFSLGANNVANVTGPLTGRLMSVDTALLVGGISIAFGILTFSRRAVLTVGKSIVALDHFSSLISVVASAITVWVYSIVGVPVSATQSIVGAVIGAGLSRGVGLAEKKTLLRIVSGWVFTPVSAGILSAALFSILKILRGG
ncbi:MAG: inorganic phosphate transporter [Thermotogae bacterium]|nr:MAG: inorganic phosphate transporter [Thermotogota bacterium]